MTIRRTSPHRGPERVASRSTGGGPIPTHRGRCADTHLGCPCRGDETMHAERSSQVDEARAQAHEPVDCPECGSPTTPLSLLTWGNCRVCRTAHSRAVEPLRW